MFQNLPNSGCNLVEAHAQWIEKWARPRGPEAVAWFERDREIVNVQRQVAWSGLIGTFLSKFNPRPNECFKNAWEFCQQIEGSVYVEGIFQAEFGRLLQTTTHAWNIYEGQHVDITPVKNGTIVVRGEYIILKKFNDSEIALLKNLPNAGCWFVSLEYYDKHIKK